MIKISNSKLLQVFTKLLILLAIAKSVSLALWWYLPSDGVELNIQENYQPKYQRVDFTNMLSRANNKQSTVSDTIDSSISITNMVLKGLYATSTKGYVIVAMRSAPKTTSIIAISEEYQGYTLKSITSSSAIFQRQGKDYVLNLEQMNKSFAITPSDNASDETASHEVSREDIAFFSKDPQQIWKDISIIEVKNGDKISGFKVTNINPKSKFASLGLKINDLIIRINNVTLESYKDAIEIYKNIDNITTIQIVVIRENQEKELVYEIN